MVYYGNGVVFMRITHSKVLYTLFTTYLHENTGGHNLCRKIKQDEVKKEGDKGRKKKHKNYVSQIDVSQQWPLVYGRNFIRDLKALNRANTNRQLLRRPQNCSEMWTLLRNTLKLTCRGWADNFDKPLLLETMQRTEN